MGFKQLKPMKNICVKTDYEEHENPNQSTGTLFSDVFHSIDYIKHPKTSPIYSKTNSSSATSTAATVKAPTFFHQSSHRHSIVTLLEPPTTAGCINIPQLVKGRRNSENLLLVKPPISTTTTANMKWQNSCSSSSSSSHSSTMQTKPERQQKPSAANPTNQSGLIIQRGKLLLQSADSRVTSAMKKSRIPRKIRIPIFRNGTGKADENQCSTMPLLGGFGNKGYKGKSQVSSESEGSSHLNVKSVHLPESQRSAITCFNFHNANGSKISTTPDKTKLVLISTPAITITSESIAEEESNNDHDLNHILENFIEATSPCPSPGGKGQESIVTEFGIIDTSKCVDFGIYDFLSENHLRTVLHNNGDEVEVDNSSDTDASYLEASPPHRFSDSDFELLIEPLAITLDTSLFSSSNINFDMQGFQGHVNRDEDSQTCQTSNLLFTLNSGHQSQIDESGKEINKHLARQQQQTRVANVKKPLRRNISLPATMFKLSLIGIGKTISSFDNSTAASASLSSSTVSPTLQRRSSAGIGFHSRRLSRLNSISSTEVERLENGSLESLSTVSMLWSNKGTRAPSFSDDEYRYCTVSPNNSISVSSTTDDPDPDPGFEDINEDNENVFSDIEKRALTARNARQLLQRQDTLGNIAPPDFCNT